MLLVVDLGNTNVVLGLYEGEKLVQTFRVATVRSRTEDEYAVLLAQLLSLRSLASESVTASIIASVVPQLTDVMVSAIRQAFGREPLIVGPGIKTGMAVLYDNPQDVGADRIVDAVAAYARFQCGLIIVDFGTATTFNCVSPKGEYLGGVIVPGVKVSLEGLMQSAAKLRPVELTAPPHVLGRNTTHAIQSGSIHGYAAMVDGLVDRLAAELEFPCRVIATGGLSSLIGKHAQRIEELDPNLTLEGLRILYERNKQDRGQVNRRAIIGSLGALLFSAGGAIGLNRLAAKRPNKSGPGRLISLTPAITETLLALNAVDQLIAVSNYCVLPSGLELPRVGSSLTPSFEAIAGLRPSLILSDDSAAAKRRELAALASCEVLPWLTLDEVVGSTQRLGELTGQALAGDALAQRLKTKLSRKPPPDAPRVLLLLSYDPDRPAELWFIKPNSLHGSALAAAGARNAIANPVQGLPRLSVEELLKLDPDDVLIMPPPHAELPHKQRTLQVFSALAPLRAVKEDRIAVFNGTQSVGPSILELVDALARTLKKLSGTRPVGGTIE